MAPAALEIYIALQQVLLQRSGSFKIDASAWRHNAVLRKKPIQDLATSHRKT